jgi:hypothetical protein
MLDSFERQSFEVKTFYKVFISNFNSSFPWKSIWRAKSPLRLAFFTWTTSFEKILTLGNLHMCHILVIDWCYMCKKNGETPDNLLLHCNVMRDLCNLVF